MAALSGGQKQLLFGRSSPTERPLVLMPIIDVPLPVVIPRHREMRRHRHRACSLMMRRAASYVFPPFPCIPSSTAGLMTIVGGCLVYLLEMIILLAWAVMLIISLAVFWNSPVELAMALEVHMTAAFHFATTLLITSIIDGIKADREPLVCDQIRCGWFSRTPSRSTWFATIVVSLGTDTCALALLWASFELLSAMSPAFYYGEFIMACAMGASTLLTAAWVIATGIYRRETEHKNDGDSESSL